jgi:hypothetical protein
MHRSAATGTVVIRAWNASGTRSDAGLDFGMDDIHFSRADLLERPVDGGDLLRPWEIATWIR